MMSGYPKSKKKIFKDQDFSILIFGNKGYEEDSTTETH